MAKSKNKESSQIDHVVDLLRQAPAGMHDINEPLAQSRGLPTQLAEYYLLADAALLFFEAIELYSQSKVVQDDNQRWVFGQVDGDDVAIDDDGRVWQWDESLDSDLLVGSRLDRWLWGQIDAQSLLFDAEGEFVDSAFDESGELSTAHQIASLRAIVKRDKGALAQRYRLAVALLADGDHERAREWLEDVVADDESFAWAWHELAKISEAGNEFDGALQEQLSAAEAAEKRNLPTAAAWFWGHVARLAVLQRDAATQARAAARVTELAPGLRDAQLEGLAELIEQGQWKEVDSLAALLRAVWPRDVAVLAKLAELARIDRTAITATNTDETQDDSEPIC